MLITILDSVVRARVGDRRRPSRNRAGAGERRRWLGTQLGELELRLRERFPKKTGRVVLVCRVLANPKKRGKTNGWMVMGISETLPLKAERVYHEWA